MSDQVGPRRRKDSIEGNGSLCRTDSIFFDFEAQCVTVCYVLKTEKGYRSCVREAQ